jgi:integrase
VVLTALAEHLRVYPASGDEFVFRAPAGGPWTRATFNPGVWDPARKAAGLPTVSTHDLRHFYASALIRAGLNPKVVAERLGHADPGMTLRVYSHLWADDEDRTRAAIDDIFGRKVQPDVPVCAPRKDLRHEHAGQTT